ncbi:MAG: AhpC/TSA family protein [Xanthobacteraceae bacterium]|nr:AhpC/TSA family protein [Xanthobacteraceae bacterium]
MNETQTRQELKQAFERLNASNLSLTEQLDAAARSVKERRPDFAAAIDRLVGRLTESSAGSQAPQVGDEMPPFYLPDENGRVVSLGDLIARGPVAVTFHRGHWCPFCRISINALVRAHAQVAAVGGQIVAVMPEREQFVSDLRATSNAPFLVLTDMDNGYAMALGLAIWVGDEMQKIIAERHDLAKYHGNDTWMLPIPATFVVGQDGRVKARFVDPDYRKRMAIDDLLAAMRA